MYNKLRGDDGNATIIFFGMKRIMVPKMEYGRNKGDSEKQRAGFSDVCAIGVEAHSMCENEIHLLEMAKKGDIDAFEQLVESYQKKAFNIAYRMLGNYDDANDLVQETFIRIFKSIKNFKGQSSFSTWVYRITTNVCLDELRKRKNKHVVSIDQDIKLDDNDVKRQIE